MNMFFWDKNTLISGKACKSLFQDNRLRQIGSLSGRYDSKIYRQKVLLEVINSRHINYQESDDEY